MSSRTRSSVALTLAVTLSTACVTQHRIVVDGHALQQEVAALESTGHATVTVEDIHDDDDDGVRRRETISIDQPIGSLDERRPVRDWIRNCAPGHRDATGTCPLDGLRDFPIEVRRFETRSAKPAIRGVVGGVIVGGLVAALACGFACPAGSTAKRDSEVVLVGYGVVIGVGLIWVVISCFAGRRGTCHD